MTLACGEISAGIVIFARTNQRTHILLKIKFIRETGQ